VISIRYQLTGGQHRLTITGHAGYAPAGSDIVCAGVSALSYALLGYLRQTGTAAEAACRKGEMKFRCGADQQADSAFSMAMAGYQIIARTYPQYVEVIEYKTPSQKGEERKYP